MNEETKQPGLPELRNRIDEIDTNLHDLIMERAALMGAISAAKQASPDKAFFLRPGREAYIQRRLQDRHHSKFPLVALLRMWREMINGMTSLQTDLKVAFYAGARPDRFINLVSNQFGSAIPLIACSDPETAFQMLEGEAVTAVVLPLPESQEMCSWWKKFMEHRAKYSIIMRLPFARAGNIWPDENEQQLEGFVISRGTPEQSDDDRTIIAARLLDPAWRPAKKSSLTWIMSKGDFCLMEASTYYNEDTLQTALDDEQRKYLSDVHVYGAYASPVSI